MTRCRCRVERPPITVVLVTQFASEVVCTSLLARVTQFEAEVIVTGLFARVTQFGAEVVVA